MRKFYILSQTLVYIDPLKFIHVIDRGEQVMIFTIVNIVESPNLQTTHTWNFLTFGCGYPYNFFLLSINLVYTLSQHFWDIQYTFFSYFFPVIKKSFTNHSEIIFGYHWLKKNWCVFQLTIEEVGFHLLPVSKIVWSLKVKKKFLS